jgi:membrane protein involved in colicin uptake
MPLTIFIVKKGAADIEMVVEPTDTVRAVRDRAELQGHRLRRGVTNLAADNTLEQLGVVAGDRLLATPNSGDAKLQARRRLERNATQRSWAHPQLLQAVRADGDTTRTLVKSDGQETRDVLTPIAKDAKDSRDAAVAVHELLLGKEAPRRAEQTDKERLKQLRLLKRHQDNEIGDLREREDARKRRPPADETPDEKVAREAKDAAREAKVKEAADAKAVKYEVAKNARDVAKKNKDETKKADAAVKKTAADLKKAAADLKRAKADEAKAIKSGLAGASKRQKMPDGIQTTLSFLAGNSDGAAEIVGVRCWGG